MKDQQKVLTYIIVGLMLVAVIAFAGCKKEEAPAKDPNDAVATTIEQTNCPVMEGKSIDKAFFVEYKGKKVYFCCAGCKPNFEAKPEDYISKLPQFKN